MATLSLAGESPRGGRSGCFKSGLSERSFFGGIDRLPLLEPGGSFVQYKVMQLTLPANIEARLSQQSTALHLAIGLFVSDEATLGQAAEVAGLSQAEFLRELGKRRIPIHYGAEELAEDLRSVESLAAQ